MIRPKSGHIRPSGFLQPVSRLKKRGLLMANSLYLPGKTRFRVAHEVAIRPKSGHIRPTGFRSPVSHRADLPVSETAPWQSTAPTLHDLQPRDVFRELLHEKHIDGDELGAVFDELLALMNTD
jgi:hypothetical protein